MSNRPKPNVGQKLWVVHRGLGQYREVTSVRRKYFDVQVSTNLHAAPVTFHIDYWHEKTEHSATYRLYESEQEHLDEHECNRWWYKFNQAINYNMRISATVEQWRAAAKILGITLDEEH
ncbi:MAG: hypothetical protein ACR2P4_07565 [Gammaproteobacteria bacterium]